MESCLCDTLVVVETDDIQDQKRTACRHGSARGFLLLGKLNELPVGEIKGGVDGNRFCSAALKLRLAEDLFPSSSKHSQIIGQMTAIR